jgi:hypothetical protein
MAAGLICRRLCPACAHDDEAVQTALDLLVFTDRVTLVAGRWSLVAGRSEGFEVSSSRLANLTGHGIAYYPFGVAEWVNVGGQAGVRSERCHIYPPAGAGAPSCS